jgi:CheY-like chemotaxis protein
MVLCVVDDLLFSVKISTAAKAMGIETHFVRSADQVVARVREMQPQLVIFDLNSAKLRPIETLQSLKADPALASVPTLGFVSHVDTPVIAAARAAGVGEVLARSAFTQQLRDILERGRSERP